jgi:hypothetical protein
MLAAPPIRQRRGFSVRRAPQRFATIVCKDMLHHLPTPAVLWAEVWRRNVAGAALCVINLVRPADESEAARMESVSADEHPRLKRDFVNSLCTAFTPDEVRGPLWEAGLPLRVERISTPDGRLPGSRCHPAW